MGNIARTGLPNLLSAMNTFPILLRNFRRLFSSAHIAGVLAALVLFAGVLPTPVEAQVRRGFVGRGFGGPRLGIGLGLGFGLGLVGGLAYSNVYGVDQNVYVYTPAPPVYYYAPQVTPQYVVVQSAPAVQQTAPVVPTPATPAPAVAQTAPVAPSTAAAAASTPIVPGKTGRIVYDSNAKPIGVIILNADGTQEFIPLTP
jgi:hypothetical protein